MWIDPSLSALILPQKIEGLKQRRLATVLPSSCRCRRYDQRLCLLLCLVAVYCRGHGDAFQLYKCSKRGGWFGTTDESCCILLMGSEFGPVV